MFRQLFSGRGTPEPGADLTSLQDAVVRSVAADMTDLQDGEWEAREWVYLAVNHEVSAEDGLRSSTQAAVLARHAGAELEKLNFRLSPASKAAMLALRDAMAAKGQAPWTILDLTLDRGGQADFSFSYDAPPRLNGDLLHSPLKTLLERYLSQHS
jgi:hypothetical protein